MTRPHIPDEPLPSAAQALRRGWTTGSCATAAACAAMIGLLRGTLPTAVQITLPKGQTPTFDVAHGHIGHQSATASVIKDAGDDPDVTHGVAVCATISSNPSGAGLTFVAGEGVGVVTLPGLPVSVGEPAINPGPRKMIEQNLRAVLAQHTREDHDWQINLSIPHGRELAQQTWNPRLGIVGGLSILGTTGVVIPYSCSAWIHSIYQGIDVANAMSASMVGAATGRTSEDALIRILGLSPTSLIDMGDFFGAMCRYIRKVDYRGGVIVATGLGKAVKIGQGRSDLRAKVHPIDFSLFSQLFAHATENQRRAIAQSVSAGAVAQEFSGVLDVGGEVARSALIALQRQLPDRSKLGVMVVGRDGQVMGRAGFIPPSGS